MTVLMVVALALALTVARWVPVRSAQPGWDALELRMRSAGAVAFAVASLLVIWYVWGAVVPVPSIQDEASYLLQARIFATGHWTAPSPPIPEFFEQPHVLVVPAVASKYPPGHALLMAIGALLHFVPLVPLLLTGATAAMLFVLAARVSNAWVASLACILWTSAPIVLRFQPSYLSELTTATLVLVSWWLLLEWRATRKPHWLLGLALAVGWGAITRPLTMLAFAIPIGVVVLRDVWRVRQWRQLVAALILGTAVMALIPLWSARTTRNWRLTPLELYRRDYLPFDKYGFTPDTSSPRRAVPPALQTAYDFFREQHLEQGIGSVPRVAAQRAVNIVSGFFQGARFPLLVLALIGVLTMAAPMRFAVASALLLFILHLPYAHWAPWTLYYLETAPVLAMLVASGAWWLLARAARTEGNAARGAAALSVMLVVLAAPTVRWWHHDREARTRLDRSFAAAIARLPDHSIVFVHYTLRSAEHISAVRNAPDLRSERVWVVHDLGARNAALKQLAPDRQAFDFDEDQLVGSH